MTYDGLCDLYVKSFSDFQKAFQDSEYVEQIRPYAEKFIDNERVFGISVARDVLIFDETN